jgi:hypothetical protein
MTSPRAPRQIDPAILDRLRRFELSCMSVEFTCDVCQEALWFTDDEVKTLGDLLHALDAHTCWADDDDWFETGEPS